MQKDRRRITGLFRSEFLRNVATLISGTGFAQLVAIAIYPALTRMYTPDDFGIFALYMGIIGVTTILATGRYELAIMIPEKQQDARGLLALSSFIAAIVSLVLMVLIAFFRDPFSRMLGNEAIGRWLWFVPLSTLLVGLFNALKYFNNRAKGYRTITAANVAQSFTNSAVKLAVGSPVAGPAGLIFGTVLGQVSGFLVFLRKASPASLIPARKSSGKHTGKAPGSSAGDTSGTTGNEPGGTTLRALAKEYSAFPKFNMSRGTISFFSNVLPIFVLTHYFSSAVAGLFSLGYSIIHRPMGLVISAFFQVLFQNLIEKHNRGQKILPDVRKFLRRLAIVVLAPFLLFLVFAPVIFRFVFGAEWEEAGRYTQLMIPWLFVVCLSMPLSFIPDMFKRQATAMVIDTVKLVLRVGALAAGVYYEDVYLTVGLFSGISFAVVTYNLVWYLNLVRKSDEEK
jgi:O-antigen/teichoic acid export membrane protein